MCNVVSACHWYLTRTRKISQFNQRWVCETTVTVNLVRVVGAVGLSVAA